MPRPEIEKIRKLLRLANDERTPAGEREAARNAAKKLADQAGIDLAQLEAGDQFNFDVNEHADNLAGDVEKRAAEALDNLQQASAEFVADAQVQLFEALHEGLSNVFKKGRRR